ncbi:methyl-accepting chemotaxis protein [Kineosporia babensis]|uniref:Methyl-accepting chemotaxis protein n=1 Tax=Kineosporia babensis TaxID=499548 RepID=A0A9X1NH56_9ACTN|nr:methyl-accepting chemotaxis protein [Kineosporia babensis]MCD5315017.1 methyl-accepting chemotaxis protein [Kineosporia babensis]
MTSHLPRIVLSDAVFEARHRVIRTAVWATLVLVAVVWMFNRDSSGSMDGMGDMGGMAGMDHSAASGHHLMLPVMIVLAIVCVLAGGWVKSRSVRSSVTVSALMLGAIALVHAGGGLTDLHFGFFVLLALAGLYQDLIALGVATVIVALHHLVIGLIAPEEVFSDPRAQANPVPWALMHAAFVIALVAVQLITWRFARVAQDEATSKVMAAQERAGRELGQAADEAARLEHEQQDQLAAQLAEREQIAARLDQVLERTASTGRRIGEETSTTMDQIGRALQEITHAVSSASGDVNLAVSGSADARKVIGELERAIGEIAEVASLINSVAEQTNLLALNATIEAARAGEAGRGFSVVAEEVKTLAGETAAATARIEATVAQVQSGARAAAQAVGGIGETLQRLSDGQEQVRDVVQEQAQAVITAEASLTAAAAEVAAAGSSLRR